MHGGVDGRTRDAQRGVTLGGPTTVTASADKETTQCLWFMY